MISVRWRPSSWMQFAFFFFNRPWHGPTTDDRSGEFPDGWLPSNDSTYGICERNTRFQIPQKNKITRWKIGRARGPTARLLTNASYTNTRCSTGQVSISTEVSNTEEKNAYHLVPPRRGPTTEYYPFKRCEVPMGHPVGLTSSGNMFWHMMEPSWNTGNFFEKKKPPTSCKKSVFSCISSSPVSSLNNCIRIYST